MKFCIYYGVWDGEAGQYRYWTFKGQGFEDAIRAPTEGVQHIVQENLNNQRGAIPYCDIINQKEYYVWRPDQGWLGVDQGGYETYIREKGFAKYITHGYSLRNEAYHECLRRALKEGLGG